MYIMLPTENDQIPAFLIVVPDLLFLFYYTG